ITLMTLHNAKGLEFPTVFMIGAEDGIFPHSRAIDSGDIEEERRLCYVGITRARERLYMTYASQRTLFGERQWNQPSRFLDEIPAEHADIQRESAGARYGGAGGAPQSGSGSFGSAASSDGGALPMARFKAGDDVEHANFGEGVVIGVEPGNMIVVRFSNDGSERKFIADYAPITKRAMA
ncbi:MAG TPA: 3'-5' exonuclease, partial [Solirubrobacterales bacterium]|nr:3'-5' exonuclease [Solirubrobacterales bacterium]